MVPDRKDQIITPIVPVVYRLNMRDANSYFLARSFPMRDKDILYVANAPATELQKFLSLVGSVTSPAVTGTAIYATTK